MSESSGASSRAGRCRGVAAVGGLLMLVATFAGGEEWGESTAIDEAVASDEVAMSRDERTLGEVLAEYARNVPNYGYDPGSAPSSYAFYVPSFDIELEADHLEYQALLASLLPGARASFEGVVAERVAAWRQELERAEAQRKRDEAEYAVFIEEHLRRQYEGRAPD